MRKALKFVLAAGLVPTLALADCDWKTGITPSYGGFLYTKECHISVGQSLQDLKNANMTIVELGKAIEAKNEEIQDADQRVKLWKDTSTKLEDHMNEIQRLEKRNMWLYMGVGVLVTGLAVIGVGQLRK